MWGFMKLADWGKILGIALVLIATTAIAADFGIKVTTQKASWRYKITVEVETPEGLKTGYAVREARLTVTPQRELRSYFNNARTKGEAVVVDLGKRGVLFAVMNTNDYRQVFTAFPTNLGGATPEGLKYYEALQYKHPKANLSLDVYPRFVHFRDLKNPKTIEIVYETEVFETRLPSGAIENHERVKTDHMEDIYGMGVRIKGVTVEMTTESITWKIEKWLPWLPLRKNIPGYLGGTPEKWNEDPSNTFMTGSEFLRGEY